LTAIAKLIGPGSAAVAASACDVVFPPPPPTVPAIAAADTAKMATDRRIKNPGFVLRRVVGGQLMWFRLLTMSTRSALQ
jgi:hypothetical protein